MKSPLFFNHIVLSFFYVTQLVVFPTYAAENISQLPQNPTGQLVPVKPIEEVEVELQVKRPTLPEVAAKKDSPLSPATVEQLDAKSIKKELGLSFVGSDFRNASEEFDEKWMLGNEAWYYIVPTGELYRWNGTREGMTDGDELIGRLTPGHYEEFAWVKNWTAESLRDTFDFQTNGNFFANWSRRLDERWFQDGEGQWYYIIPDGSVYRWDSETREGMFTEDTLIAQLEPADHDNLDWLSDLEVLVEFQYGEVHLQLHKLTNTGNEEEFFVRIYDPESNRLVEEVQIQEDFRVTITDPPDQNFRRSITGNTIDGASFSFSVFSDSVREGEFVAFYTLRQELFSDLFNATVRRISNFELVRLEGELKLALRNENFIHPFSPTTITQWQAFAPLEKNYLTIWQPISPDLGREDRLHLRESKRDDSDQDFYRLSLDKKHPETGSIFVGDVKILEINREASGLVRSLRFEAEHGGEILVTVTPDDLEVEFLNTNIVSYDYEGKQIYALVAVTENGSLGPAESHRYFVRIYDPGQSGKVIQEFEVKSDYRVVGPWIIANTLDDRLIDIAPGDIFDRGAIADLRVVTTTRTSRMFRKRLLKQETSLIFLDDNGQLLIKPFSERISNGRGHWWSLQFILNNVAEELYIRRGEDREATQFLSLVPIDKENPKENKKRLLTISIGKDPLRFPALNEVVFEGVVEMIDVKLEKSGLVKSAIFRTDDGKMIDVTVTADVIDVRVMETLVEFAYGESILKVERVIENGLARFFVRIYDPLRNNKLVAAHEVQRDFEFFNNRHERQIYAKDLDGMDMFFRAILIDEETRATRALFYTDGTYVESDLFGPDLKVRTHLDLVRVDGELQFVVHFKDYFSPAPNPVQRSYEEVTDFLLLLRRLPGFPPGFGVTLLALSKDGVVTPDLRMLYLYEKETSDPIFEGPVKVLEVVQEDSGLVRFLRFLTEDGTKEIAVTVLKEGIEVEILERVAD